MRSIRDFQDFLKQGVVKKQKPDFSRAQFLIEEAEKNYRTIHTIFTKIGIDDDNANTIVKSCYDILMGLIRANMLVNGYNSSGFGAHEAEVSYMKCLGFREKDIEFADQLRYFRNGMLYYGTILGATYAKKVIAFILFIYPKMSVVRKNDK